MLLSLSTCLFLHLFSIFQNYSRESLNSIKLLSLRSRTTLKREYFTKQLSCEAGYENTRGAIERRNVGCEEAESALQSSLIEYS